MSERDNVRSRSAPGSTIATFGVGVFVVGVGPLLLYGLLGPADGNPIGLGLLAMVSVPVAGMLVVLGLIKMLIEFLVRRYG